MVNTTKKVEAPITLTVRVGFANMKDFYDWKEDADPSFNSYGTLISAEIVGVPPVMDVSKEFSN